MALLLQTANWHFLPVYAIYLINKGNYTSPVATLIADCSLNL